MFFNHGQSVFLGAKYRVDLKGAFGVKYCSIDNESFGKMGRALPKRGGVNDKEFAASSILLHSADI